MKAEFPTASVRSFGAYMWIWVTSLWKACVVGLGASVLVGVAFALSQAGCRNDAITYAKAVWPEAQCSAIYTDSGVGPRVSNDTAVCRVGDRRLMCAAGYSEPKCETIAR